MINVGLKESYNYKIRVSDTGSFIKKATFIHGTKYDYNLVNYIGTRQNVEIICPIHKNFFQKANRHLGGKGCPKCARLNCSPKLSIDDFIKKANIVHNSKYDYTHVDYNGYLNKVLIVCPTHGKFYQKAGNHLNGNGCMKCRYLLLPQCKKLDSSSYVSKANAVHNSKFKYIIGDSFEYQNSIEIICPTHGSFLQMAHNHLNQNGCPKCAHHGFNPDKEATLYYIKDKDTGLYKIGITNNSLSERFGKAFLESRAEILMEETYENGQDAYLAEQEILQAFKPYRCNNDTWPEAKGGKTEFFNRNILEL